MLLLPSMVILMTTLAVTPVPELPTCPQSPNCVSSQVNDSHRIEPFSVSGDVKLAFAQLKQLLSQRTDTKLLAASETTITVEFRTMLGFVDDGLFVLDGVNNLIHIRSAARLGYWDFGKNRSRMEEIRMDFTRSEQSGQR